MSFQGSVCLGGVVHPSLHAGIRPPPNDRCKNITFQQLRLRVVMKNTLPIGTKYGPLGLIQHCFCHTTTCAMKFKLCINLMYNMNMLWPGSNSKSVWAHRIACDAGRIICQGCFLASQMWKVKEMDHVPSRNGHFPTGPHVATMLHVGAEMMKRTLFCWWHVFLINCIRQEILLASNVY